MLLSLQRVTWAAEEGRALKRLTVAVLVFQDKTGASGAAHWRHTLQRLITDQLSEVKSLRMLLRLGADFSLPQVKVNATDELNLVGARKIGEFIEARRVVWGNYQQSGGKWQVTVRVLNVATSQVSTELKAESADWWELRDELTGQILKELGVTPSEQERLQMLRRWTTSPVALECYSQAYAWQIERKPHGQLETKLREAVAADPQFAEAFVGLAATLASQGKLALAEEADRQALKIRPGYGRAHQSLGVSLLFQENYAEGEKELREALRLDPDDPDTFIRLGELYGVRQQWDETISLFNEAKRLDPIHAVVHAELGRAYALKGDREKALAELKEAEHLNPEDAHSEQVICQAYETLHETSLALEHYERFVRLARKMGLYPEVVGKFEEHAQQLKATLTPHYLSATAPKVYTDAMLEAALRGRLSQAEYRLISNPLSSTPQMKRWAEELTHGATDDLAKANRLFEALIRRIDPGSGGSRSAREVFAAWNDPWVSFRCQEYARLYVALARDLGIKAFFVLVDQDFEARTLPHACAGVFVEDKALLVDPAYRWFGVPHKEYEFLDDLQATAVHLTQFDGDVPRGRVAVKLLPNSALANFNLALNLMEVGQINEAGSALQAALQLESDSWLSHYAQGVMASCQSQWDQAVNQFRASLALNPAWDKAYYLLAGVLGKQGKLKEAREQYRACLRHQLRPGLGDGARHAIAEINERLGEE